MTPSASPVDTTPVAVFSGAPVKLPALVEVRELFQDLVARRVQLTPGPPFAPTTSDPGTYALYVDDSLLVRAVVVADLRFSAHAAAAIGLLPVAQATEAIDNRLLSPTMAENLYEVLNICASLLNDRGRPHVRLHAVHHVGAAVPPHVPALARTLGRRADMSLDLAGYGFGRFSVVVVA